MDSLSQIVLGAAVGEIILGKKIGNRAMLWGAVAGTIPDLDVVSNLWLDELSGLAAHRGISHSISFAIVGSVLCGYIVDKMYGSPYHRTVTIGARYLLFLAIIILAIVVGYHNDQLFIGIIASIAVSALGYIFSKRLYKTHELGPSSTTLKDWISLFFWGLFTHAILDCFTVYGTQLFAPFSDMRVAWSTISVADPLYTVPFLICLIITSFLSKESKKRRIFNYLGIGLSCGYLLCTVINKQVINQIFATSLHEQGYESNTLLTTPTILNNILWYGVAKKDSSIVFGKYSYFDSDQHITFYEEPIGEHLITDIEDTKVIRVLKWFSANYYQIIQRGDILQFNDMRYGRFSDEDDSPDNYIFNFKIKKLEAGQAVMIESQGGPPPGNEKKIFSELSRRIRGYE